MGQDCGHSHAQGARLSGAGLSARLARAERRLALRDQRLTPPRRRVLELMLEVGQPVKAYDLMAAFDAAAPAKPPTVYRALDFLEREGLIHRIESLNAYVACRIEAGHDAAFLICDCCGAAQEIEPRGAGELAAPARMAGFDIKAVTIEAHGLCAECR